jgi:hypothetical protein
MKEAVAVLDPLIQAANNKITTMFVAAGTIAVGQTSSVKSLNEIPLSEIFQHELSALAWTMLIASAWIIVQFLSFAGVFRGIAWLWRRISARRD